jgi:hypothetical protein
MSMRCGKLEDLPTSPARAGAGEVPRETTKPRDESLMGGLEEEEDEAGQVV